MMDYFDTRPESLSPSRSSLGEREEQDSNNSFKWRLQKAECQVRRHYIIFAGIMFIVVAVVVIVFVSRPSEIDGQQGVYTANCPSWAFPCDTGNQCINQSYVCDGIDHCLDGSDESSVCDPYQNSAFDNIFTKRVDENREKSTINCSIRVPKPCKCQGKTALFCQNKSLTSAQLNFPSGVTSIDISLNDISVVTANSFQNLSQLTKLFITSSRVESIVPGAFSGCHRLEELHLISNRLTNFTSKVLSPENTLTQLILRRNELTELYKKHWEHLSYLKELDLSKNKIHFIEDGTFSSMTNLKILRLHHNSLTVIKASHFSNLHSLKALPLRNNLIATIEGNSFGDLTNLNMLDLSYNRITSLNNDTFLGLGNLTTLLVDANLISSIERGAFKPFENLKSLDVHHNKLVTIDQETLLPLKRLDHIYFDKFHMCLQVPLQTQSCSPNGDGISSKANMLENVILRVCVWLVGLLACGGNVLVILGRFLLREDNQIHSFFIKNLSCADLLMGLYLLIIAVHDIKYRGQYIMYDQQWRDSWGCDLSGFLSTVSSEMSVMTLSIITLDRYLSITYPLSFRRRGLKVAYCVMALTWALCILLAALPIMGLPYFGSSFYGDNAVCIPLHLHEPRGLGWEYSSFLFIGLNLGSFGFIAYAYVAMFYSIHMSALPLRTSRESKERCLVKRFFFIVVTDFLCWIPIIVIKILALSNVAISGELYAWVIVFILPVNSALNPLLYTLTTKMFKKKLMSTFTSVVFRPVQQVDSTHSQSSSKNNTSLSRNYGECELGLLRRYFPTSPHHGTGCTYVYTSANGGRPHQHRHHHHGNNSSCRQLPRISASRPENSDSSGNGRLFADQNGHV